MVNSVVEHLHPIARFGLLVVQARFVQFGSAALGVAGRLVAGRLVVGRLVVGRLVVGRLVVGRFVVGRFVVGRLVAGRLVAGRLVAGRLVVGCVVAGRLVVGCFVVGWTAHLEGPYDALTFRSRLLDWLSVVPAGPFGGTPLLSQERSLSIPRYDP